MTAWTDRVRLHGGRNTHAARPINGDPNNLVTGCDHMAGRAGDHPLPGDAPVTCRRCLKEMNR